MSTQLFRCTDPACGPGLRKRGPYLFVCRPEIGATRRVLPENIMMRQRIAEELESILAAPLCFLGVWMHREARHHGDIGVDRMTDRNTVGLYDPIIVVHPLLGLGRIDKRKSQGADAELRGELDGLAVGAGHPDRRMRLL